MDPASTKRTLNPVLHLLLFFMSFNEIASSLCTGYPFRCVTCSATAEEDAMDGTNCMGVLVRYLTALVLDYWYMELLL